MELKLYYLGEVSGMTKEQGEEAKSLSRDLNTASSPPAMPRQARVFRP